jgi:hypothetical protein
MADYGQELELSKMDNNEYNSTTISQIGVITIIIKNRKFP